MLTDLEDRVAGVLLATACGDALGGGYEFGAPLADTAPVSMSGGNGFGAGEWTDDTAMTVAVALAAAEHDLQTSAGLDAVGAGFLRWYHSGPVDIGIQTQAVLSAAAEGQPTTSQPTTSQPTTSKPEAGTAAALESAARAYLRRHPDRSSGNGALMRTAPVALATLHAGEQATVRVALAVGALTHADPVSGEACALWTLAVRHAVRHGSFAGLRLGLSHLSSERAAYWSDRLDEAEQRRPRDFARNGWVVEALQGAWSAIVGTPVPDDNPYRHLRLALENAVRGGRDADTVAAIAGGLLGARWGASSIPPLWMEAVHGWPGYRAVDLAELSLRSLTSTGI